jgi:hypothetical protein
MGIDNLYLTANKHKRRNVKHYITKQLGVRVTHYVMGIYENEHDMEFIICIEYQI